MRAVQVLEEEHRLLRRALECFEVLLEETVQGVELDGEAAATALEFLERFADGCHQDKEEDFLFPKLLSSTSGEVQERVRGLLGVHEHERELLGELRAHFEGAAYGEPGSLSAFVCAGRRYVELQRAHAESEDRELFPLAREVLGAEDDGPLLGGFARLDARYLAGGRAGPGILVAKLVARLGADEQVGVAGAAR